MAIEINGSGTITGIIAGGYPDATVTADDLAATLDLSGKTVTLADGSVTAGQLATTLDLSGKTVTLPSGAGGKVLQIVQDSDNAAADLGAISPSAETSALLTVSITPTYSNSKMLILANAKGGTGYAYMAMRIKKDGTALAGMTGAGSSTYRAHVASQGWTSSAASVQQCNFDAKYVETLSGASTSTAISYTIHFVNTDSNTNTLYFNRGGDDSDTRTRARVFSNLIVMEIAP